MKCSRDLWTAALDLLKHATLHPSAASTSGTELLTEVLVEAQDGRVCLHGNDTQTEMLIRFRAEGDLAATSVPYSTLCKLTKASKKSKGEEMLVDPISSGLRLGIAGRTFELSRGRRKGRVALADIDWADAAVQNYDAGDFGAAIKYVARAICTDPSRSHLHALHFRDDHLLATDGHRLHACRDVDSFPWPVAIHPATVGALQAAIRLADPAWVMVRATGRFVQFDVGGVLLDVLITSRIVDEKFPPWKDIVPNHEHSFAIDAASLVESLRTAQKIAGMDSVLLVAHKDCRLEIEKLFSEVLKLSWRPKSKVELSFNPKYALDAALGDGELVRIEYSGGEHDPILVRPDDDRFAVVMPTRRP